LNAGSPLSDSFRPGRHSVSKRTASDIRFSDGVFDRRNLPIKAQI
jgi:hypothetical protein